MSSSHIASKGKKSAASSSAANKQSQSNGTQVCTVDYSSLDCDALEDVLKRCVQRGKDTSTGSNGIHHNAVDEMLKTARKGVDQEEKNFEFAQNISMEHERDRSSKGKRTESVVIERENDSADMVGRGLMAAMDQQSLGSAGSSKASSNASDESEEMDISGGSHPGSDLLRNFNGGFSSSQLNGYGDQDSAEAGRPRHHAVCGIFACVDNTTSVSQKMAEIGGFEVESDRSSNRSNTMSNRSAVDGQMFHRNHGADGGGGVQLTVLNNNRRSGSQSDPSPMVQESAEYLKRKAGRHNRLQKLTKYTQKKPDRTSGASINSAWLKAFEKAEAQSKESGGDILDALSSEFTHQKTIAPLPLEKMRRESTRVSPDNHATKAGKNRARTERAERSPSETLKNEKDFDIPYAPLINKSTDQSDSDQESFRTSDLDHSSQGSMDGPKRDSLHRISDFYGQGDASLSASLATSVLACDMEVEVKSPNILPTSQTYDGSAEGPSDIKSCGSSLSWDTETVGSKDSSCSVCRSQQGVGRTNSESSRSSAEKSALSHRGAPLDDDIHEDGYVDDGDKSVFISDAVLLEHKRKKKKKKSKRNTDASIPNKCETVMLTTTDTSELSTGVPVASEAHVLPSPVEHWHQSSQDKTKANEAPGTDDGEKEFQVVTRRLPTKVPLPSKSYHGQWHNNPSKQNGQRNRNAYQSAKVVKQSASATVPPAASEYSQLKRRNSAGDINQVGLDHIPVGIEAAGDNSDRDSVRSMPVSKGAKSSPGKTTSAPATRLPTPGISYADITKGAHSSINNASLTETALPQSAIETATFETSPVRSNLPREIVANDTVMETLPEPRNADAEGSPKKQALQSDISLTNGGLTNPAVACETGHLPPAEKERVPSPREFSGNPPAKQHFNTVVNERDNEYVQTFYPDCGETTNPNTYETHMALLRTMRPTQPLAPRNVPQIYRRPTALLPAINEDNPNHKQKNKNHRKKGIQTQIFVSHSYQQNGGSQQFGYQNGLPGVYQKEAAAEHDVERSRFREEEKPDYHSDRLIVGDPRREELRSTTNDVSSNTENLHVPLSTEELWLFMEQRFNEARLKCLEGAAGYRHFKP